MRHVVIPPKSGKTEAQAKAEAQKRKDFREKDWAQLTLQQKVEFLWEYIGYVIRK